MSKVTLKHPNESFESLMRRWKKAVEKSEILKTLREYECYEKPCERRKRLKAAAVKRWQRQLSETALVIRGGRRVVQSEQEDSDR